MGCLLKQGGGLYARWRIGAVLLAAGEGRRMGGIAKCLIRLQGVPLIRRHLIALSGAGVDEVAVVTGYAHEAVEAQVQHFPVTVAYNAGYALGQQSSVRVGLGALAGNFDAILVVLADQPLIAAADVVELVSAFKRRAGKHVLIPMVGGQRGNPIILDETARAAILASEVNLGCRQLIVRQPDLVQLHATSNRHFIADLDTLDDINTLATQTGWRLELPTVEGPV